MNIISDHEFIENRNGELVLLLNTITSNEPSEPVFLVSPAETHGYLHRNSDHEDIHQIIGINPSIIERVRKISTLLVIEMTDHDVIHTYPAIAALDD